MYSKNISLEYSSIPCITIFSMFDNLNVFFAIIYIVMINFLPIKMAPFTGI
jgi:hypothetical protein